MRVVALGLLLLLLPACSGGDDASVDEPRQSGPPTLLFAASEGGGSWDIYVEDVASGRRTNLTDTPGSGAVEADERSPVLSPDGKLIAYTSTADNEGDGAVAEEIFVMSRSGTEKRRLTDNDGIDADPQWTPAGRILFTTCPFVRGAVPRCGVDLIWPNGTGRRTAFPDIGLTFGVSLAPAGDRIAYTRFDERLRPVGVFVAALASGEESRVADGVGGRFSPDGERIAFLSDRDRNGRCLFHDCTGHAAELYVAGVDGSDERRLTETLAQEAHPSWTPDGEWILFSRIRDEDDDYDVYAVRADGECEVQLTDTTAWEWSASWSGSTDSLDC